MTEYTAIIGCYGGRRGTTLGMLTQERVNDLTADSDLEIMVLGRGNPKWMEGKADKPIEEKHVAALRSASQEGFVERAVKELETRGRKPATREDLLRANAVYTADDFIRNHYLELAGEANKDRKYQTFLEGADMTHALYGEDVDDTEMPVDFVLRVIIPKKKGETPANITPGQANYFSPNGAKYIAGTQEARNAEARDLVEIAKRLADTIVRQASL